MFFYNTPYGQPLRRSGAHLVKDNWNDYGYYTLYRLYYVDGSSLLEIGLVKIEMLDEGSYSISIPNEFENLE